MASHGGVTRICGHSFLNCQPSCHGVTDSSQQVITWCRSWTLSIAWPMWIRCDNLYNSHACRVGLLGIARPTFNCRMPSIFYCSFMLSSAVGSHMPQDPFRLSHFPPYTLLYQRKMMVWDCGVNYNSHFVCVCIAFTILHSSYCKALFTSYVWNICWEAILTCMPNVSIGLHSPDRDQKSVLLAPIGLVYLPF